MIVTIVREQLRRQRGYVASLIVLVAAAVGFATFAITMAATQGRLNHAQDVAHGDASPYYGTVVFTDEGLRQPPVLEDWGKPMTIAEFERLIEAANAEGAHARADVRVPAEVTLPNANRDGLPVGGWPGEIRVAWGEIPWEQMLEEGSPPRQGEIVLSGHAAAEVGVSIGDQVVVGDFGYTQDAAPRHFGELRVSGIAYDYSTADWDGQGLAILSPDDVDIAMSIVTSDPSLNDSWPLQAELGSRESTPALTTAFSALYRGNVTGRTFGSSSPVAWLVAGALTLGTVIVAFALGRAQAADRAQWTATARALGARRSHLLGAAGLEWTAIAMPSAVIGIGGGLAAAWITHDARLASLAAPPPIALSFPSFVFALMIGLAVLLAAIIVLIPAVAAVRVPPTAALKETAAQDEVEISRRVPVWPVVVLAGALLVALMIALRVGTDSGWMSDASYFTSLFLGLALAVAVIAVVVEGSRRAVMAFGRRLTRSSRPWALHAGMTLIAHPRQAAAIVLLHTLTLMGLVGWHMGDAISQMYSWGGWAPTGGLVYPWEALRFMNGHTGLELAAIITANALAVVLMRSSLDVTDKESSTARALGLTTQDARFANATAWGLASAMGAAMGWAFGVFVIGTISALVNSSPIMEYGSDQILRSFFDGSWTALVVVAMDVVLAAVTSILAAWALKRTGAATASR